MTIGSLIAAAVIGPLSFFFFRNLLLKRRERKLRKRKMNAKYKKDQ